MNDDEKLDISELQHYFHDIEPENPLPDSLDVVRAMSQSVNSATINSSIEGFTFTWKEFQREYSQLDGFTEPGGPQVLKLLFVTARNFLFFLKANPSFSII